MLAMLFVIPNLFALNDKLIIASIPGRDTHILIDISQPLISLLRQELSMPVQLLITHDYQELGKRLNAGAADLGVFGGNSYVESKEQYPGIRYLATCKQPTEMYFSQIIVHRTSHINSLDDLRGKSFGFTDRGSTSGYIYPMLILNAKGLDTDSDFKHIYFLKKHDKVYDAVAYGSIDAGGVSSSAFRKAVQRNGDVFRIIARSEPIPRTPIVAGPHLSDDLFNRIREILRKAESSQVFKQSNSPLKGFSIKDDSFYDIIRKARNIER